MASITPIADSDLENYRIILTHNSTTSKNFLSIIQVDVASGSTGDVDIERYEYEDGSVTFTYDSGSTYVNGTLNNPSGKSTISVNTATFAFSSSIATNSAGYLTVDGTPVCCLSLLLWIKNSGSNVVVGFLEEMNLKIRRPNLPAKKRAAKKKKKK